jgi:hypothetical protein
MRIIKLSKSFLVHGSNNYTDFSSKKLATPIKNCEVSTGSFVLLGISKHGKTKTRITVMFQYQDEIETIQSLKMYCRINRFIYNKLALIQELEKICDKKTRNLALLEMTCGCYAFRKFPVDILKFILRFI